MAGNPWRVDSIQSFNYFCCPECVYRSKEELTFQAHALQNHPQSETFFCKIDIVKPADDLEDDDEIKNEEEMVKSEPEENEDMFDPDYELDSSTNNMQSSSSVKKKRLLSKTINTTDENTEDLEIDETSHSQSRGNCTFTVKKPAVRNKEYVCGFCPQVFTKRCDWRIHKKQKHTYEMKLMVMKKCDSCDELFPNDKQLSKHTKLKHENGKHLCDECGKEYSSHKLLYNHKMYCHIRVNCEICDKTVAKGLLKRHMDTVHAGKKMEQFLCAMCPYTAHARRYLTEHIKKHHSTT